MNRLYHTLTTFLEQKFRFDAHYFLKGGFWLLTAQASTVLGSLIAAVLFARYLSETDYGVYRYIIGLAALLSAFSLTGIGQTILQASSKGYGDFLHRSTSITLQWSLGIMAASLIGAMYYYAQGNQLFALGCLLIALLHPVSQLFQNTLAYLYGAAKFKSGAKMQTFKSIFVSGVSVIALLFTKNILILLAVYFSTQAIAAIVCYLVYQPEKIDHHELDQNIIKKYLSYAKHSSYRNFLTLIAVRLDSVVVFQLLGAVELAFYTVATVLPEHITGSFKNMQTLLLPKYTKHDSLHALKRSIPKRSLHFFIILILFTAVFILLTPLLYSLLFPKYTEVVPYVQLLALSFPASVFILPLGAIQSQQMEKELYIYQITTSLIQISTILVLISFFGFLGAVISRIITQYSRTMIAYVLLYRNKN
jgi:O-antigen/teichoic acid export membrane protein